MTKTAVCSLHAWSSWVVVFTLLFLALFWVIFGIGGNFCCSWVGALSFGNTMIFDWSGREGRGKYEFFLGWKVELCDWQVLINKGMSVYHVIGLLIYYNHSYHAMVIAYQLPRRVKSQLVEDKNTALRSGTWIVLITVKWRLFFIFTIQSKYSISKGSLSIRIAHRRINHQNRCW